MNCRILFERELQKRGIPFTIDDESGRHVIEIDGSRMLISLDNLHRDLAKDEDRSRVSRFVNAIIATSASAIETISEHRLYWCLEPNDYELKADFRVAMSNRVDRVLVHLSSDGRLITWVTSEMLGGLDLSESDAGEKAFANLAKALSAATIESRDIDGVSIGLISTTLPLKASLILAPNLREFIGAPVGWPVIAVVPDRDFVYVWAARHTDFARRVGPVVVREFSKASYPISTEVYEISDHEIRAIGEFPTGS